MTPVTYVVPGERSSPRFGHAFAKGCRGRVDTSLTLKPGPVALFASPPAWRVLVPAITEGREFFYGDHGVFGRGTYFRISRNTYQPPATGPVSAPERWRAFGHPIQPWRRSGRHIVVCPNSPVYCGLHGFDVHRWLTDVVTTLRAHTDREIRVRWKTDEKTRPLAKDLVDAWAVVVFSSASAVWALLAGVPIVTLAPWASTWRMGATTLAQIEHPVYPDDRLPFMTALANHQWTLHEMANGMAWRALRLDGERHAA